MNIKKNQLCSLFFTFLKIGAFTFGGGYAMIPLIQREICEKRKWLSDDDIMDIIAIAESTPGPVAINAATFIGYRVSHTIGAFLATLGVVLPSFIIIVTISAFLQKFNDMEIIKRAFQGIRAGVLALIFKALITMYRQSKKSMPFYILAILAFICVTFFNINAIFVIIGCAANGLILSLLKTDKENL